MGRCRQDAWLIGGGLGRLGFGRRRRHGQQFASQGDALRAIAVGEQAVVADAMEALGQDVQQEAPDELVAVQGHRLPAVGPLDLVITFNWPRLTWP